MKTRPNKPHKTWLVAELKQPITDNSLYACVVPVKGMSAKYPLLHSDLGAISVVPRGKGLHITAVIPEKAGIHWGFKNIKMDSHFASIHYADCLLKSLHGNDEISKV